MQRAADEANLDFLARLQARALAEALDTRARELRTLHEQYQTLPPCSGGASHERHDQLLALLDVEQAVLAESLGLQDQLGAFLHGQREMLLQRHAPQEGARPPETNPTARVGERADWTSANEATSELTGHLHNGTDPRQVQPAAVKCGNVG